LYPGLAGKHEKCLQTMHLKSVPCATKNCLAILSARSNNCCNPCIFYLWTICLSPCTETVQECMNSSCNPCIQTVQWCATEPSVAGRRNGGVRTRYEDEQGGEPDQLARSPSGKLPGLCRQPQYIPVQ
jgi:hypothetical protein